MRTLFQKQSSRKTVSFEEQNTVVPKIRRHSLSCHIPYCLAWRPIPEKPGIWSYKTIFSFHWDTTKVWRPRFDVKMVLLSRKTGSVSIGKRLLHFTFGDAQLLKFGYLTIRGRLPLTTAFNHGQIPHHQTSSVSPSIKNRGNMCQLWICTTAKKLLYKLQCYTVWYLRRTKSRPRKGVPFHTGDSRPLYISTDNEYLLTLSLLLCPETIFRGRFEANLLSSGIFS